MKPTLKMRAFLGPGESPPEAAPAAAAGGGLAARKGELERALAETREERRSGRLVKALREGVREVETPLGRPQPAAEDAVTVRVVGTRGGRGKAGKPQPRVPLPGLAVELRAGEEAVAQATTDLAGLAVLPFPEALHGAFEVHALAPDCKVAACHRGRRTEGGKGAAALLEVGYAAALAPAFDKGGVWLEAGRRVEERAAELEQKIGKALENQEKVLADALSELEEAITGESAGSPRHGGSHGAQAEDS